MSLTLVATPFPFDVESRVQLDITSSAPIGASANFLIQRTNPDGRIYPVIMELNPRLTSGAWSGYDYHAPFGVAVQYTVTIGATQASSASVTLASTNSWLIHRSNPALSVMLDKVASIADRPTPGTSALHWPIGAEFPIGRNEGTRHARSGQIVVQANSQAMKDDLDALLHDSGVILLNLVAAGAPMLDETWAWIQPGDVTWGNPADPYVFYPSRNLTIPYQVMDQPAGTIIPLWTYADAGVTYGTYPDFAAAYESYADAVIDNRVA